jgi:methyl-accepting chemotaxis protein
MRLAQTVRLGAWLLVSLNLLMALGSIWVFIRMAPVIEVIIEQNERSLQACEKMLASLAMADKKGSDVKLLKESFVDALKNAQNNITEIEEPIAIDQITRNFAMAFEGDVAAKKQTVGSILLLGEINRDAMVVADKRARQFGNAGAWGVVFMATAVFLIGMLFIRSLKRSMLRPLDEIQSVLSAYRKGDRMRRCTGFDLPKDIKILFNDLNEFLDKDGLNYDNALTKQHNNGINQT